VLLDLYDSYAHGPEEFCGDTLHAMQLNCSTLLAGVAYGMPRFPIAGERAEAFLLVVNPRRRRLSQPTYLSQPAVLVTVAHCAAWHYSSGNTHAHLYQHIN
jgi:hypothetical protein